MAQIPPNKKSNLEYIKELRMFDDSFMNKVFEQKECVELLLQIALDRKDLAVKDFKIQNQLTSLDRRTIKLDIYAVDSVGKLYDIEVQRADQGASAKRARFHSAQMDSDYLKKRQNFDALPESYVIFITENDYFGKGKPIYHIKRIIEETGDCFGDETHIIYINGSMQDETELGRMMHDFFCTKADDMYYSIFADRVRYLKEDEEGVKIMCRLVDALREEVRVEERENSIRNAVEIYQEDGYSVEKASEKLSSRYMLSPEVSQQKVAQYWQ